MSTDTLERLHPVQRMLGDVLSALNGTVCGDDLPLWSLGGGELDALLTGLTAAADRLRVQALDLVAEGVRRGRPDAVGATSPTVWLAGLLHVTPGAARRMIAASEILQVASGSPTTSPVVRDARLGAVGLDQAMVAADAIAELPADVSEDDHSAGVRVMREQARVLDPDQLRRLGQRLVELVDPAGAEVRLAEALHRAERRAHSTRELVIGPERDGAVRGRFLLPAADAAVVRTALDALAKPGPATTPADGASTVGGDPNAGVADPWVDPVGAHAATATRDDRTHLQRMADALVELAARSLTGGDLPASGGEKPQLVVLIDLDDLREEAGAAELLDGTLLTADQLRRIACDSSVLPAVLGGTGQPLDIGRETRTIPTGLRRALIIRDRGCAFPGCDRPPGWTDAHHVRHWADGGITALDNLVLLCRHHHRTVHHQPWTVSIASDGHPQWSPPPWVAPPGTRIPARLMPRRARRTGPPRNGTTAGQPLTAPAVRPPT